MSVYGRQMMTTKYSVLYKSRIIRGNKVSHENQIENGVHRQLAMTFENYLSQYKIGHQEKIVYEFLKSFHTLGRRSSQVIQDFENITLSF